MLYTSFMPAIAIRKSLEGGVIFVHYSLSAKASGYISRNNLTYHKVKLSDEWSSLHEGKRIYVEMLRDSYGVQIETQ